MSSHSANVFPRLSRFQSDVIVPWRVVACVIVHKQSEIRTLEKHIEIFRMTSFLHFFCTIIQPVSPRQGPKTCVVFIAFVVQSMNCQQPFPIVVLTSNNTEVLFTVGKTGNRGRTSVLKHEILRLQRLGKQTSLLDKTTFWKTKTTFWGDKTTFWRGGIFDPGFFGVQRVSKGYTPEV